VLGVVLCCVFAGVPLAPPNREAPAAGVCLGSSFFCPKLNPPPRGVLVPLGAGVVPPNRLPPVFCSPPAAGAALPKIPPGVCCGVVVPPPKTFFCSPPFVAAGFAPNIPPGVDVPLPNVVFC
jgi:hypothetical protein